MRAQGHLERKEESQLACLTAKSPVLKRPSKWPRFQMVEFLLGERNARSVCPSIADSWVPFK